MLLIPELLTKPMHDDVESELETLSETDVIYPRELRGLAALPLPPGLPASSIASMLSRKT